MEHPTHLEELPPFDTATQCDMETARKVLECVVMAIEPDTELTPIWSPYAQRLLAFTSGQEPMELATLRSLRIGLESLEGEEPCGEYLVAAAKMCLTAFLYGPQNPYINLYPERSSIHDDLEPIVSKGLALAHSAAMEDPFQPGVRINHRHHESLQERQEQDFMRGLLNSAIRPE